jgi:hypothetical protein
MRTMKLARGTQCAGDKVRVKQQFSHGGDSINRP